MYPVWNDIQYDDTLFFGIASHIDLMLDLGMKNTVIKALHDFYTEYDVPEENRIFVQSVVGLDDDTLLPYAEKTHTLPPHVVYEKYTTTRGKLQNWT